MESILISIKKMLGIEASYTHFDDSLIVFINSVLMNLTQLGVGPNIGFVISGETENWSEFIGTRLDIEAIKTYVYLKVRLLFDPPTMSSVLESMERQVEQFEWRIRTEIEKIIEITDGGV